MLIDELNTISHSQAFEELFKCCGSTKWANNLADCRPFSDINDLLEKSDSIWEKSTQEDGLEAFSHHPKIGDVKSLETKFASTKQWAGNEQAGVNSAKKDTLINLANGNQQYENKFGYIFIVCATGKSAEEMLELLNARITNDSKTEFTIAMNEQNKITKLRLEKLLS